jgi:hypothetical protein
VVGIGEHVALGAKGARVPGIVEEVGLVIYNLESRNWVSSASQAARHVVCSGSGLSLSAMMP